MSRPQSSKIDRILAVDDSPDNLFLVQTILEDKGYQVSLAENGSSALSSIEKSPPDLILLDVMMPGMDGYEVTRRVRQSQDRLGFIPILLITAHQQSSVVEGLDAGADDFIRKPVDMDELLARVRSLLRLKHSIDEREQMSRQREDFVSRLTHDLRTPLVAADRMLNLFLEEAFGTVSPEMREVIDVMIRSNKSLLQMVNTLLEVYRHDAGSKTLTFSPVNLYQVVQEVIQELKPLAQMQDLNLQVEVLDSDSGGPSSAVVLGDRLELRRVLTNLVGNAIKFTDQGSVTVRLASATPEGRDGDQPPYWMKVEVEDTGAGILPADQATLFERFRQGDHKRAGSGLGLYLSRRIIEAHKGLIEAKSQIGQGSVFTIWLPVHPA
jgi:two-component system, sensor histidine kinase and response regulator